ncbi:MAG: hypothetical protein AAFP13_03920 [Pseudomonadota bacterium]
MSYFREKLSAALNGMAQSDLDVRTKLADAYSYHLLHAADHLPDNEDVRSSFEKFGEAFSRVEDKEKGSIRASIDQMSDNEVEELVSEICGLVYYAEFSK